MTQLPPRRFEDANDPRFDSIRHLPWFEALSRRKWQLDSLRLANALKSQGMGVCEASGTVGVDRRELSDYSFFVSGKRSDKLSDPIYQKSIDRAYLIYCLNKANIPFRICLSEAAGIYKVNPRHLIELWDVDSTFKPSNYKK